VVDGLAKPIGVAKLGSTLVITDARRGAVIAAELAGGRAVRCHRAGDRHRSPGLDRGVRPDTVVVTSYRPDHRHRHRPPALG